MHNPRKILSRLCNELSQKGFGTSSSGNCSIRDGKGCLLTATGVSLGSTIPRSLVSMDMDGNVLPTDLKPTKEFAFHLGLFKMYENISIIVHVHPAHSIALSLLLASSDSRFIPAATPQFVMRCGRVPLIPYAHPGTAQLTENVMLTSFAKASVMINHGVIVVGNDPKAVMGTLEELEENCQILLLSGLRGTYLDENAIEELLLRKM